MLKYPCLEMNNLPLHRPGFWIRSVPGFIFLTFLLISGCGSEDVAAEQAQSFEAVGVIKTITPTKNYVNIDHEDIPGFMDAMAMFFPVSDTSILQNVAVNDSVIFTIKIVEGNAGISAIQKKN